MPSAARSGPALHLNSPSTLLMATETLSLALHCKRLLCVADTLTSAVINAVEQVNILNTGRGTIDSLGNLAITLEAADTALPEMPVPDTGAALAYDLLDIQRQHL